MPIALLIIGGILLITAFNNTMGQLATALESDVPGYFKWIAAISAILGLGYVKGLQTPSRILLALVAVVIVVTQYKAILAGFTSFASSGGGSAGSAAANPVTGYAANPSGSTAAGSTPSATQISGTGAATSATAGAALANAGLAPIVYAPTDPNYYLAQFGLAPTVTAIQTTQPSSGTGSGS